MQSPQCFLAQNPADAVWYHSTFFPCISGFPINDEDQLLDALERVINVSVETVELLGGGCLK